MQNIISLRGMGACPPQVSFEILAFRGNFSTLTHLTALLEKLTVVLEYFDHFTSIKKIYRGAAAPKVAMPLHDRPVKMYVKRKILTPRKCVTKKPICCTSRAYDNSLTTDKFLTNFPYSDHNIGFGLPFKV